MVITITFLSLFVAINILAIISGFLPIGFSTIMFLAVYFLFVVSSVSLLIIVIINSTKKKFNIVHLIILILFLIDLGGYFFFYNLERGYNEVNHSLKSDFNNYKIVGIKDSFMKQVDKDNSNVYVKCNYVFDIKLDDSKDVTFQAGFCSLPGGITNYEVKNSYNENYLKYYFDKYKKENNTSLKMTVGDNYFLIDQVELHCDNSNVNEVEDFIKYLKSKDNYRFEFYIVNDDNGRKFYNHSFDSKYFDIDNY